MESPWNALAANASENVLQIAWSSNDGLQVDGVLMEHQFEVHYPNWIYAMSWI